MIYPFISGIFIDYVYNTKQELLYKNQRIPSQDGGRYEAIVGGLFNRKSLVGYDSMGWIYARNEAKITI